MGMIEGIRIRNFKTLKDISLGDTPETTEKPLTPMTVVIGKNGAGKSSIFDALGFLSDCLKNGVEAACDMNNRGGYERIHSQGQNDPISFDILFRLNPFEEVFYYSIVIALDKENRPYVYTEWLSEICKDNSEPRLFLFLKEGKGFAVKGNSEGVVFSIIEKFCKKFYKEDAKDSDNVENIQLSDNRQLGIATLSALKQHPRITTFRNFLEGWYLSYFTPDSARSLPLAGPQHQLNIHGDNLGNVVQFMEREHKNKFNQILEQIAKKIPGLQKIDTVKTDDGRLLLRFFSHGFGDKPFYAQQMSDGTLKVFAYLLLLASPTPATLLCIEEPENGLYHKLLETLIREFRQYATGEKDSSQIFITTHQPYLVDNLNPDEVWILEKGEDGFSTIRRASSDPLIQNLVDEGLPLGSLWYSNYLDKD